MTDYTTIAKPVHVLQEARYIRMYWPTGDQSTPDSFGCTPHLTLTIEHMSGEFRATESSVPASFPGDGTHREALTMRNPAPRVVLARQPAPRFSAPRFLAFTKSILG